MKSKENGNNFIQTDIRLEEINNKIKAMEIQIINLNKQNMELIKINLEHEQKIIYINNLFHLLLKKVNSVIEMIKNF